MDLLSEIAGLAGAELNQEAAGFTKLSRIPSTGIIKLRDYWATLPIAERTPLLDELARLSAKHFFPSPKMAKARCRV
jgi:hypothetical protein